MGVVFSVGGVGDLSFASFSNCVEIRVLEFRFLLRRRLAMSSEDRTLSS